MPRILYVEDNDHDALAFRRSLQKSKYDCEITHFSRAETAFEEIASGDSSYDLIISDYSLPGLNGLEFCREMLDKKIQLPMILLTGEGSETLAVKALRLGVDDYLVKDTQQVYLELLPLVIQEVMNRHENRIARKRAEEDRERLIVELKEALQHIKTLRGIIPICSCCKKIRDGQGFWDQVESYIQNHSEAQFSHSLCPDCFDVEMAKLDK